MSGLEILNVLSGILGAALILLCLDDVFHNLFHPAGQGRLSGFAMRGTWRLSRRLRRRPSPMTGPVGIVAVIAMWVLLQVIGWALVYLPQVPAGFAYSPGVDPSRYPPFFESLYLSLVALTTLGFGDVVPTHPALRILAPLEALTGFVLFTACVSWIMQLYPALNRRRTAALTLGNLLRAGFLARLRRGEERDADAIVLTELAGTLAQARADLTQNGETYYFADRDRSTGLAPAMASAWRLASAAERAQNPSVRSAGAALAGATASLTQFLEAEYLRTDHVGTVALIAACSRDRREPTVLRFD